MSKDLNRWQGIGRLGSDPEVKYMPSGKAVANLSIACNDDYKDKDTGELVKKTEWVRIVMFGKPAEVAGEYLRKGSQAYFEGKLTTREWEDKQGNKRYTTEVNANYMQMLGSGSGADRTGSGPQASAEGGQSSEHAAPDDFDQDSIPF